MGVGEVDHEAPALLQTKRDSQNEVDLGLGNSGVAEPDEVHLKIIIARDGLGILKMILTQLGRPGFVATGWYRHGNGGWGRKNRFFRAGTHGMGQRANQTVVRVSIFFDQFGDRREFPLLNAVDCLEEKYLELSAIEIKERKIFNPNM